MKNNTRQLVVEKPWGRFEQYCLNTRATVKIITVNPNQKLSLQRHQQRDETWIVLEGPAGVQKGRTRTWLQRGEQIHIPKKTIHRLYAGNTTARILEISTGEFDERDIERLEDDYGRHDGPNAQKRRHAKP